MELWVQKEYAILGAFNFFLRDPVQLKDNK
jgi:hypothetical protein